MEKSLAPENVPPVAASLPATPVAVVTPAEDPAAELERLRKENDETKKRLADKDKHISDLSTEKATLESRLSGYQAVETLEPVEPAKEGFVRPEDIPMIIERTSFINKMKDDNKDMMEFGLEPVISFKADQLIRQGKSFNEAVSIAVKEQREKFDKIKQPEAKTAEPVVPSSLRGEGGANQPVEQKPKAEELLGDEGEERKRLRAKRGL